MIEVKTEKTLSITLTGDDLRDFVDMIVDEKYNYPIAAKLRTEIHD